MKKLVFIAAIAALQCGCTAAPFTASVPDFDKCYTMEAELEYGDFDALAEVTRNGEGSWKFSFTEPSELMGVTITLDDDDITASLGELSLTTPQNAAWSSAPAIIADCLDSLPTITSESIIENEGVLTITSEQCGGNCAITADKATGRLISLKHPYYGLAVHFSNQEEFTPQPDEASESEAQTEEHVGLVIE